jgi:hypothetical protein
MYFVWKAQRGGTSARSASTMPAVAYPPRFHRNILLFYTRPRLLLRGGRGVFLWGARSFSRRLAPPASQACLMG